MNDVGWKKRGLFLKNKVLYINLFFMPWMCSDLFTLWLRCRLTNLQQVFQQIRLFMDSLCNWVHFIFSVLKSMIISCLLLESIT